MKLTDEYKMSQWAYFQCVVGNNTEEIRNLITNLIWIYWYCKDIDNRKDMREKLRISGWYLHYRELI